MFRNLNQLTDTGSSPRIADELVNSGNAPASPRSNEELDQILLKAAELIRTGARQ